ncbi:MAG TPA: hypothetical protein PK210_04870 [Bacteroidia bacterium]|nr:hypothetical protein [Bacteroidia bacterium]
MQSSNPNTTTRTRTKKRKTFELLISKAELQNPDLWNCMLDIEFSKESMSLELDQFAKCGKSKSSLYQIGSGEFVTEKMKYSTTLN